MPADFDDRAPHEQTGERAPGAGESFGTPGVGSDSSLLVSQPGRLDLGDTLDRPRVDESQTYRDLVEAAGIGIAIDDARGQLCYVNSHFAELFGYDTESIWEQGHHTLVHPDDRVRVRELHERRLAGEAVPARYEFLGMRKDGQQLYLEVDSTLLYEDGRVTGTRSYLWDVTDRKRAEAQQLAAAERLAAAQRLESLGVFAGGVAHDLNNLLTVIQTSAELLLEGDGAYTEFQEEVNDILESVQRAARLTSGLVACAGQTALRKSRMDPTPWLYELLSSTPPGPGVLETLTLGDDLPPIRADARLLGQALDAIRRNSVEALGPSGGSIRIGATTASLTRQRLEGYLPDGALVPAEYLVITVEDDGEGMTDETLRRAFEPFYTTRFLGRGLGLPAALGLIRGHGGGIRLDSKEGRGCRVTIVVPSARPHVS